jgi:integrase
MRFPNGYGSVYKLSGKRRRPFIVRKTTGWDDNGKQTYQTIGYYESRPKAMAALAEFNKNPYTIEASTITFAEIYGKWSERRFDKLAESNIRAYKMAYNLSIPLYDLKFVDIRTEHLQDIIDDCGKGYDTLRKIRVLFNQLYDYAMEHDIVTKKYADYVEMPEKEDTGSREPFTKNEIQSLWHNIDRLDFIDTILIMIYTGLRISELLLIKNANINLNERCMKGGIKTAAGKNRIIPINKKLLPLIKKRFDQGNEFLIVNFKNEQMKYDNYYREKWIPTIEQLEMKHTPHDCRHTCATLLDNAGANKLSIKRILGHASQDITDKIYTHKDIEELIKAIDLI